jgi:hypothetical protein
MLCCKVVALLKFWCEKPCLLAVYIRMHKLIDLYTEVWYGMVVYKLLMIGWILCTSLDFPIESKFSRKYLLQRALRLTCYHLPSFDLKSDSLKVFLSLILTTFVSWMLSVTVVRLQFSPLQRQRDSRSDTLSFYVRPYLLLL